MTESRCSATSLPRLGFILIELSIVIAIIAIVVSMLLPALVVQLATGGIIETCLAPFNLFFGHPLRIALGAGAYVSFFFLLLLLRRRVRWLRPSPLLLVTAALWGVWYLREKSVLGVDAIRVEVILAPVYLILSIASVLTCFRWKSSATDANPE